MDAMIASHRGTPTARRHGQRGVVLLVSLILLIALTLGGIALFRQVTTGVLIASNLTFKNAALVASDRGAEHARQWLMSFTDVSELHRAHFAADTRAYYPTWCGINVNASNVPDADGDGLPDDCKASPPLSTFDPLTYGGNAGWNASNSVLATSNDGNGNEIRYVIHRLCRVPGTISGTVQVSGPANVSQECVAHTKDVAGGSRGAVGYGTAALVKSLQPYYRVTTRTQGVKNTVTYTQTILY